MIPGSLQAQAICEKDFNRPFIKKVVVGNEERTINVNEAGAESSIKSTKKERNQVYLVTTVIKYSHQ